MCVCVCVYIYMCVCVSRLFHARLSSPKVLFLEVLAENVIHRTTRNAVLVCSPEDAVQASANLDATMRVAGACYV